MQSEQQLDAALDLMRRLPPKNIEDNLAGLIDLVPDLTEDLLSSVDQPLQVRTDSEGKEYLICDYNRDGDSYRSPWTNKYDPPLSDGTVPSGKLRELESAANDAFSTYREMYYEGGVSSVYLWDLEEGPGFAGVILIKKTGDGGKKVKGSWDSIHVVEVTEEGKKKAVYKLTSTVMLWLQTTREGSGTMSLGGSMTRQAKEERPVDDAHAHLSNIGEMIETMEFKVRSALNDIYFGKTKDIVNDVRAVAGLADAKKMRAMQEEVASALRKRSIK